MRPEKKYYVTGGSLRADTPSYVERRADAELFQALKSGEFCYVLTSRQMGKTSLIVRTAAKLCAEQTRIAVLDLTAIGQNVQPDQWYYGLLCRLGEQIGLEDELDAFWTAHEKLGPLQRWIAALREVALTVPSPLVIFIDEIDAVRSLPIATGEFFAAIRECYNRRTQDDRLERLTFCLMGVASPTDLIRDTRTTPFNIGRRIELTDFAEDDSAPLEGGLEGGERPAKNLLRRILHWTGGHPYLTQRFCKAVANNPEIRADAEIDRLCQELFLSPGAQERDDNLIFVRDRILRSEADHVALIDMYAQVLTGKKIRNDESNPLVSILRLSGIVKAERGRLVVRNRIYAHVFNREWTLANTPYAEILRQEKAYRRGVFRAAIVFGLLAAVIGGLSVLAVSNVRLAALNAAVARESTLRAQERAADAEHLLYTSDMNVIQREWDANNIAHVSALLAETKNSPERGFEWNYWNRLTHRSSVTRALPGFLPRRAALSPDGRRLALTRDGAPHQIALLSADLRGPVRYYNLGPDDYVGDLAFTPDGRRLLFRTYLKEIVALDLQSGKIVQSAPRAAPVPYPDLFALAPDGKRAACLTDAGDFRLVSLESGGAGRVLRSNGHYACVCWTPDSRHFILGDKTGGVTIFDAAALRVTRRIASAEKGAYSCAVSPDGRALAVSFVGGAIEMRDLATGNLISSLRGHTTYCFTLKFSPDSKLLVSAGGDSAALIHDTKTGEICDAIKDSSARLVGAFWQNDGKTLLIAGYDGVLRRCDLGHGGAQMLRLTGAARQGAAFSADGTRAAVGGYDSVARIYDTRTGQETLALRGHVGRVTCVAFSRDGRRLLTAGNDAKTRIWDAQSGKCLRVLGGHTDIVNAAQFSPDERFIATASADKFAILWDAKTGKILRRFITMVNGMEAVIFTADSKRILTGGNDRKARLWDAATGQCLRVYESPAEIWGLALTPDGGHFVSANLFNTAQIWDIENGRVVNTLVGHTNWLVCVAALGSRIVTGSRDGTVKIWDATSGRELLTLPAAKKQINGVAFSPDGLRILVSCADGTVKIWRGD